MATAPGEEREPGTQAPGWFVNRIHKTAPNGPAVQILRRAKV
jgi:hypothetical protein